MSQHQPELRDMFALARAERAPAQAKERVRERVLEAAAVGVGVGATTAAVGSSIWKSALFGKLMGGLLLLGAVGGGLAVHARVAPPSTLPAPATPAPRIAAEQPRTGDALATPSTAGAAANEVSEGAHTPAVAVTATPSAIAPKAPSKPALAPLAAKPVAEGELEREASLLSAARTALKEGNLAAAQQHLLARRQLSHRSLDPEALAVEAKVLRAQGNTDASTAREAELRLRFPEHSLAR